MAKPIRPLETTADEHQELRRLAQSRRTPHGKAVRAKILLQCLQGIRHTVIAGTLGVGLSAVSKWRGRFARHGIKGLEDRPRSGKPVKHGRELRGRVLALLELPPPAGQACWDGKTGKQIAGNFAHSFFPSNSSNSNIIIKNCFAELGTGVAKSVYDAVYATKETK